MNAIHRYQEVLDNVIVGNRTGVYLSKEELQELIDYVNAAEEFCRWFAKYPEFVPDNAAMSKFDIAKDRWKDARKKLGIGIKRFEHGLEKKNETALPKLKKS